MRINFLGYTNNFKNKLAEMESQLNSEDVLEFGERPNIYKEDWDTLREYADSVHNIILALLSQKTDADILKTVHDMREFLVFDPSKWKYNSDCIVIPEESKENA